MRIPFWLFASFITVMICVSAHLFITVLGGWWMLLHFVSWPLISYWIATGGPSEYLQFSDDD